MKKYIEELINSSYNNNSILLGISESGKSHTARIEIDKYLKSRRKVYVLDFYQQYEELRDIYQTNKLSINSTNDICLFEFKPDLNDEEKDLYEYYFTSFCIYKYQSLLNLFNRKLNNQESKIILETIVKLLENTGITKHVYQRQNEFPNFADYLMILKNESKDLYKEICHFKNIFPSRKTNLEFTDSLNIISIKADNLIKGERELLLHSLLLLLNQNTRDNFPPYSSVVIDDLSQFLRSEYIVEKLIISMKTAKKYNENYLLIHQSLNGLIEQNGEGILNNCGTVVCFKQLEAEKNNLKKYFHFYDEQIKELVNLPRGQALAFNSSVVAPLIIPHSTKK